jgi:amino acid permease
MKTVFKLVKFFIIAGILSAIIIYGVFLLSVYCNFPSVNHG